MMSVFSCAFLILRIGYTILMLIRRLCRSFQTQMQIKIKHALNFDLFLCCIIVINVFRMFTALMGRVMFLRLERYAPS